MATEQELRDATDIAYLDLHHGFEFLESTGVSGPPPYSIKAIIDSHKVKVPKNVNKEWKIVDVYNDNENDGSGFYGCVIDTGDGLIVSFRGSESITDINHVKSDWVGADLALLKTTLTKQQEEAEKFLKQTKLMANGEKPETIHEKFTKATKDIENNPDSEYLKKMKPTMDKIKEAFDDKDNNGGVILV